MHSEGILAGELKHGPLALIDKQMPVIMVIMKDPCFAKCQNALQQVTARQVRALLFHTTHAHVTRCCHHRLLSVGVPALCPCLFTFVFHMYTPRQMRGTQRTACRSWLSPVMRVLELELRLSGLLTPTHPQSSHWPVGHLLSPTQIW